ncbi:MAG: DUF2098 domain-containing protein [Methanomicrobiales archaeon]|nr:DUF2098 domain-containing protein [Methanomicrobiales archaeon]NYT21195.1 DUF2098 domain-containing protein [Methanomicrobiales archaeon]
MNPDEITVGMQVRYPRTGTTGRVTRIEQMKGNLFAEIDTTGLLYRADQLITVVSSRERQTKGRGRDFDQVKKERDFISDVGFQEAISHTDQSCEGGG